MIQNIVKPRRASTEATRGAVSGPAWTTSNWCRLGRLLAGHRRRGPKNSPRPAAPAPSIPSVGRPLRGIEFDAAVSILEFPHGLTLASQAPPAASRLIQSDCRVSLLEFCAGIVVVNWQSGFV